MTGLVLRGTVRRGRFRLDAQITAAPGEVVVLLGPNGSGKTTALRAMAGLEPLDDGTVSLSGELLDDARPGRPGRFVPPRHRRIGVVFQDHRLFPHLTVTDNVAFGLRALGTRRAAARQSASEWLDRLDIGELAGRYPEDLSGGQGQLVAVARALASHPEALLLDEPLAALDLRTRGRVRRLLRRHLGQLGIPSVIVTHDPADALVLAGRIVVLENGTVVQDAAPVEVTRRPGSPYVARLMGVNLLSGRVDATGRGRRPDDTAMREVGSDDRTMREVRPDDTTCREVWLDGGGRLTACPGPENDAFAACAGNQRVLVALRPSAIGVHPVRPEQSSARNRWPGTVADVEMLGDRIRLHVNGEPSVLVDLAPDAVHDLGLREGSAVWLSAEASDTLTYPA